MNYRITDVSQLFVFRIIIQIRYTMTFINATC